MMGRLKNLVKSGSFWFTALAVFLTFAGIGLTYWHWDWLHGSEPETSASATLRNVGLLIGGVIALVFAIWRGIVAERQAAASQRQAETAEQTLLNERYQRGAEMLVSRVLAVRMEGIRSLEQLAEDQPDLYYVRVRQLISDFARDPTGIEEDQDGASLHEELRSV